MSQKCEFITIPQTPTLTIRARTKVEGLPNLIGSSYGAIMQYLGEIGEQVVGEPFVIYYNLDMQDLDVEMGFPVSKALPGKDQVCPSELPVGPAATTLFIGPYTSMAPAYEDLTKFIQENHREPTGVAIEYYLNGPETPPEQLQTRIVFPLKL